MTPTAIIDGRDVAMAFRAISTLSEAVLEKHGRKFEEYVALRQLAEESFAHRSDYIHALTQNLATDLYSVRELLTGLERDGLTLAGSRPALTDEGRRVYDDLTSAFNHTSIAVYEGMEPADVETARRVLHAVRDRAEALAKAG